MILPFVLRCQISHLIQHIFNKYSVSRGGIVDHNVRYRTDELAVLDDGATAHECVQVGTTVFTIRLPEQLIFYPIFQA